MVQEWFEDNDNEFELSCIGVNFAFKSNQAWDVLDKQMRSMEAQPQNLKDLLLSFRDHIQLKKKKNESRQQFKKCLSHIRNQSVSVNTISLAIKCT